MFLSKHSNGIYYIYFENGNGRRCSRSTGTKHKKDALKFFNAHRKKIEAELLQDVIPITLKQFTFDYLRRNELFYCWNTILVYKTTFKYLIDHFGNIQLSTLTTRMIEDYLLNRATNSSIYSARKDLICLSASFNVAVKDGYLTKNICQGIRRFKLPQVQPKFYSSEDFQKLIEAIGNNEEMKDIVIFALNSGMRQMEIITLLWNQINWEQKIVSLSNQTHITKTKRVRSIPLNPEAFEILERRYTNRKQGIDNIFTLDGFPATQNILTQRFKKYVYKAKINPSLNFHSIRHTFASWLVQNGVSIYKVSKLLGHSNVKTTEIYSHLRNEDFNEAVNSLSLNRVMIKNEY